MVCVLQNGVIKNMCDRIIYLLIQSKAFLSDYSIIDVIVMNIIFLIYTYVYISYCIQHQYGLEIYNYSVKYNHKKHIFPLQSNSFF